jgi:hypothetical protein
VDDFGGDAPEGRVDEAHIAGGFADVYGRVVRATI